MTARSFISSHRNCSRFLTATHHAAILDNYSDDLQVLLFTLERGKSSICQRDLYRAAMVLADNVKLFVRKTSTFPVSASRYLILRICSECGMSCNIDPLRGEISSKFNAPVVVETPSHRVAMERQPGMICLERIGMVRPEGWSGCGLRLLSNCPSVPHEGSPLKVN